MITSYMRGWEIYFDGNDWRYLDDNTIANDARPCKKCGKYPNKDGSDSCLGHIDNAISACCGHGIEKPYIIYKE